MARPIQLLCDSDEANPMIRHFLWAVAVSILGYAGIWTLFASF